MGSSVRLAAGTMPVRLRVRGGMCARSSTTSWQLLPSSASTPWGTRRHRALCTTTSLVPIPVPRFAPRRRPAPSRGKTMCASNRNDRCHLPFGVFTAAEAADINMFDVLVHGWDIATAVDLEYRVPNALCAAAIDVAYRVVTPGAIARGHYAPLPTEPPPSALIHPAVASRAGDDRSRSDVVSSSMSGSDTHRAVVRRGCRSQQSRSCVAVAGVDKGRRPWRRTGATRCWPARPAPAWGGWRWRW